MTELAIEAHGLERKYPKGPKAVDGIDITVEYGAIYGFLGPNGAGKSTTVHMLTTLLPPTGGTAKVAGFDVAREGHLVRENIGAALQEAALDPLLTGREHLRLQASLQALPKTEGRRRAEELLSRVGLTEAADRRVKGYSGGMKRRLDLALALIHRPKIIFLDEPTTGLDVQSRTALWEEVKRLTHEDGVTIFLTTQYLEEADVLADCISIIDHGRIVAQGSPRSLKDEFGCSTVEVVPSDRADYERTVKALSRFGATFATAKGVGIRLAGETVDLAEIVRVLDAEQLGIETLELQRPSLDDVFLEKTGRTLEGAEDKDSEGVGEELVTESK
jgi:ABC-2 type transport system ATP-binding protein